MPSPWVYHGPLIGRYTRPGVRNVALFCKHLSHRGMQAANTLRPLFPSPSTLSALQLPDHVSVLDYGRNDVEVLEKMRLKLK
jgi:hypothetical protein